MNTYEHTSIHTNTCTKNAEHQSCNSKMNCLKMQNMPSENLIYTFLHYYLKDQIFPSRLGIFQNICQKYEPIQKRKYNYEDDPE